MKIPQVPSTMRRIMGKKRNFRRVLLHRVGEVPSRVNVDQWGTSRHQVNVYSTGHFFFLTWRRAKTGPDHGHLEWSGRKLLRKVSVWASSGFLDLTLAGRRVIIMKRERHKMEVKSTPLLVKERKHHYGQYSWSPITSVVGFSIISYHYTLPQILFLFFSSCTLCLF